MTKRPRHAKSPNAKQTSKGIDVQTEEPEILWATWTSRLDVCKSGGLFACPTGVARLPVRRVLWKVWTFGPFHL
jgi:hypothetical protein